MSLLFQLNQNENEDYIFLYGEINEDAEVTLAKLFEQISKNCVFNLKNISTVNSCGVRAWINFLREAEKNQKIVFDECSPEIVSQMNMIPNFRGSSKVRSVYASYICEHCDFMKNQLFKEGENLPKNPFVKIPEIKCDECHEVMEMEELEEEFFGWMNQS